jgi:hypothetical protein
MRFAKGTPQHNLTLNVMGKMGPYIFLRQTSLEQLMLSQNGKFPGMHKQINRFDPKNSQVFVFFNENLEHSTTQTQGQSPLFFLW